MINEFFLKCGKYLLDYDKIKFIGCFIEVREDNMNLVIVFKMNFNKQIGWEIFEDYKFYVECGKILEYFIGVKVVCRDVNDLVYVKEWFFGEVFIL